MANYGKVPATRGATDTGSVATIPRPEGPVVCRYCEEEIPPERTIAAAVDTSGAGDHWYYHAVSIHVYRSWECEQQAQVLEVHHPSRRIQFLKPVEQAA